MSINIVNMVIINMVDINQYSFIFNPSRPRLTDPN